MQDDIFVTPRNNNSHSESQSNQKSTTRKPMRESQAHFGQPATGTSNYNTFGQTSASQTRRVVVPSKSPNKLTHESIQGSSSRSYNNKTLGSYYDSPHKVKTIQADRSTSNSTSSRRVVKPVNPNYMNDGIYRPY